MTTNGYLAAKPRYEILDGLRGVAAIFVVIFHLFEPYSGVSANQIIITAILLLISFLSSQDSLLDMLTMTDGIK